MTGCVVVGRCWVVEDVTVGDDLVWVGWTLIRPVVSPVELGTSLPALLTTISQCIQDDLPRPEWADWTIDRAVLEGARRGAAPDSTVMAVALPSFEVDALLSQLRIPRDSSLDLMRRREAAHGEPVGFEVVGIESDLALHSWHCHGYADQALAELSLTLNERGLLANAEDAQAVRDWMLQLPSDQTPKEIPWTFIALIPDWTALTVRRSRGLVPAIAHRGKVGCSVARHGAQFQPYSNPVPARHVFHAEHPRGALCPH
ncbi:conserved protein of unknown function [Micropruina glycogenica]|uniref:Uncharacterized protein n=1 Tax=Micropruina glycogenica TaxID=75385 RepID=A0A2N9JGY6_9ACTN|nr:conserved protein of unknown function [Micropruina glycogenica]